MGSEEFRGDMIEGVLDDVTNGDYMSIAEIVAKAADDAIGEMEDHIFLWLTNQGGLDVKDARMVIDSMRYETRNTLRARYLDAGGWASVLKGFRQ